MLTLPFLDHTLDLPDDSEIVYDMSKDRIGDAISVLCILEHACKLNHQLKISVLYYARDDAEYSWINGIDLFSWSAWKPHKVYTQLPRNKMIFSSAYGHGFSIWNTLHRLNIHAKLQVPDGIDVTHKDFNVSMHVINAVGVRDKPYVSRRVLNMDKYENIGRELNKNKLSVTRLGAAYDRVKDFDLCVTDLTSKNLTLHETFVHIAKSNIFMGGDSGLTHAAGALGIPLIVEMDSVSKAALGIAAITPELVTEIPYNCSFETHLTILHNHPLLRDKIGLTKV